MGKIFGMPLEPMVLGHLQSLAVLVDALSAAPFVHIVMHDGLAAGAFEWTLLYSRHNDNILAGTDIIIHCDGLVMIWMGVQQRWVSLAGTDTDIIPRAPEQW
jgi:hypothetical protein